MYQSTNRNPHHKNSNSLELQYIIDFEDPRIRRAFMRKVFMIVWMQLIVSLMIIALFVFVPALNAYLRENHFLMWVALGVLIVLTLCLGCFESLRRNTPCNFFLLGIYTLTFAFLLSCSCVHVKPEIIFTALGITAAVVLILILFALQTKIDFTVCGCALFIAVILLMVFSLVVFFIPSKMMLIGLCSVGVVIFCIYLIYDVQMMMGGNHRYSVSPEEYIFAAISIYTDIMLIFMYIMDLLQLTS